MKLNCDGCGIKDTFCNCSVNEIDFENTFQVFVIMESKKKYGTQWKWCPQVTLRSDFFNCDLKGVKKILAKQICN